MPSNPRVGIACLIANDEGALLVGKRKGSHGAGTWQLPGGHLEYSEKITTCAVRETLEETGLHVTAGNIVAVTNDVFEKEEKHYVTLFVWCVMKDAAAKPHLKEPHKCEGWHWLTWEDLKDLKGGSLVGDVIFRPLHGLLEMKEGLEDLRPKE